MAVVRFEFVEHSGGGSGFASIIDYNNLDIRIGLFKQMLQGPNQEFWSFVMDKANRDQRGISP